MTKFKNSESIFTTLENGEYLFTLHKLRVEYYQKKSTYQFPVLVPDHQFVRRIQCRSRDLRLPAKKVTTLIKIYQLKIAQYCRHIFTTGLF